MRFSTCLFVSTLFFFATAATAAGHAKSTYSFSGDVDLKSVGFLQTLAPNVNEQLYQIDLHLTEEGRLGENVKFIGKFDYLADPANKSSVERNFIDLPEANVKWRTQQFLFKAGSDIYTWGVTDGVNPIDLINVRNYYDPIHSKKLGATGLSANMIFGWFELDAIYIPSTRSPMLPGSNSRWLPRTNYYSSSASQTSRYILPSQFGYIFKTLPELDDARLHNVAVRLQAHLPELEMALYGYDGIAPLPIITPVVSGAALQLSPIYVVQADADVELDLQDYRQQTGGASFVKTLGAWQIKGESTWAQPHAHATANESWSTVSVFELEKSWNTGADSTLTTILQYATSRQAVALSNGVNSLSHFFDSNWMAGGHFSWRDKDSFSFFYSHDVILHAWLSDLKYERRLNDDFMLGVGATLLGGPENSPLGAFAKNKNINLEAKYNF